MAEMIGYVAPAPRQPRCTATTFQLLFLNSPTLIHFPFDCLKSSPGLYCSPDNNLASRSKSNARTLKTLNKLGQIGCSLNLPADVFFSYSYDVTEVGSSYFTQPTNVTKLNKLVTSESSVCVA